MGVREKGTAIVVVVALMLPLALPAAASTTRTGASTTTDRGAVEVEPVTDEIPPVEVNDRPVMETRLRAEVDRPERDRPDSHPPTVRERCQVDPQPDRCPDRPVNIRHLIWRLIKAGEWRQLFHLLVRLGII